MGFFETDLKEGILVGGYGNEDGVLLSDDIPTMLPPCREWVGRAACEMIGHS